MTSVERNETIQQTHFIIVYGISINDSNQILMTQEAKASVYGSWFLPAGKVERFETLDVAVKREVLEETGMHFEPINLIHLDSSDGIIYLYFYGDIVGGKLKNIADKESLQGAWIPISRVDKAEKLRKFGKPSNMANNSQASIFSNITLRAPIMEIIQKAMAFKHSYNKGLFEMNPLTKNVKFTVMPRYDAKLYPELNKCTVRVVVCRPDTLEVLFQKNSNGMATLPKFKNHIRLTEHSIRNSQKGADKMIFREVFLLDLVYNGTKKDRLSNNDSTDGYYANVGAILAQQAPTVFAKSQYDVLANKDFDWIDVSKPSRMAVVDSDCYNVAIQLVEYLSNREHLFLPTVRL